MHKNFRKVTLAMHGSIVTIFVLLRGWILNILKSFNISEDVSLIVFSISVFIIFIFSEFMLRKLINSSSLIRRIVSGRHHIEGYWFDASVDQSSGKVRDLAIIEIGFKDDEYSVEAILFRKNCTRIGTFNSRSSTFDGRLLWFSYERSTEIDEVEKGIGASHYRFFIENPYPLGFHGDYYDDAVKTNVRVYGERITDEKDIALINSQNRKDMGKVAKKYFRAFKARRKKVEEN